MKITLKLLLAFFLVTPNVFGSGKQVLNVDTILEKMANAQGGMKLLKKIKSTHIVCEMKMSAMNMTMQMEMKMKGDKVYVKGMMHGQVMTEQGFDGKTGWSKDMMTGLRELKAAEKASLQSSSLKASYDLKSFYDEIIIGKKEEFEGKKVIELILNKKEMEPRTLYLDKKTYLPIVMFSVEKTIQGKMKSKSIISDYRKTDFGVTVPYKTEIQAGPMKMIQTITTYEINTEINDDVFKKPKS